MKAINFKENRNVVRNDNNNRYMSEMNRYKVISDSEVKELIAAAQNGNAAAKNKVAEANLRIVWSIAKHYIGMDTFDDILQNGNIGLLVAIDTFDIRKYITSGLTDESRVVRQGAHIVKAKKHYSATSFDAPICNEDGEEKTLLDFMPSDMSADNFSKVEDMRVKINYLMKDLKPIEKEVICGLFGFGCREYTQYELSVKFKLTEERIRQIKFEALEKMREIA